MLILLCCAELENVKYQGCSASGIYKFSKLCYIAMQLLYDIFSSYFTGIFSTHFPAKLRLQA